MLQPQRRQSKLNDVELIEENAPFDWGKFEEKGQSAAVHGRSNTDARLHQVPEPLTTVATGSKTALDLVGKLFYRTAPAAKREHSRAHYRAVGNVVCLVRLRAALARL